MIREQRVSLQTWWQILSCYEKKSLIVAPVTSFFFGVMDMLVLDGFILDTKCCDLRFHSCGNPYVGVLRELKGNTYANCRSMSK